MPKERTSGMGVQPSTQSGSTIQFSAPVPYDQKVAQRVALLTVKLVRALDKKSARHTTLEHWTLSRLRERLHSVDQNDHYSQKMIKAKNKQQLIASILEEEGYDHTIDEYISPLEGFGVNTTLLVEISSFGV